MTRCRHPHLALLPPEKNRLRCRHCHLTIDPDDLGDGFCPECYEVRGRKHYDFQEIETAGTGITRYRCEDCGIIVECRGRKGG